MIYDEDDLDLDLANLRDAAPDPRWEERVRLRCHARISSRKIARPVYPKLKLVDVIALAVLCAFLSNVLYQAASVAGVYLGR